MPTIDLAFVLVGGTIPLDHGYSLFSALCQVVKQLHGDKRIGVHPIRGRQSARGVLGLTEHSRLRLRLPSEELAPYIALAGAVLELDGHRLRVGIPRVEALVPAAHVGARLVTFRNALDPSALGADVRCALDGLGIAAAPSFVPATRPKWEGQPMRRVLRVAGRRVIGYALRVADLTAAESLTLQEAGLGGRRRFGCGVFTPISGNVRENPAGPPG